MASITPGGVLVYNEEDAEVVKVVESAENYFRKIPYKTPEYEIVNGIVNLKTDMGDIPLSVLESITFVEYGRRKIHLFSVGNYGRGIL